MLARAGRRVPFSPTHLDGRCPVRAGAAGGPERERRELDFLLLLFGWNRVRWRGRRGCMRTPATARAGRESPVPTPGDEGGKGVRSPRGRGRAKRDGRRTLLADGAPPPRRPSNSALPRPPPGPPARDGGRPIPPGPLPSPTHPTRAGDAMRGEREACMAFFWREQRNDERSEKKRNPDLDTLPRLPTTPRPSSLAPPRPSLPVRVRARTPRTTKGARLLCLSPLFTLAETSPPTRPPPSPGPLPATGRPAPAAPTRRTASSPATAPRRGRPGTGGR